MCTQQTPNLRKGHQIKVEWGENPLNSILTQRHMFLWLTLPYPNILWKSIIVSFVLMLKSVPELTQKCDKFHFYNLCFHLKLNLYSDKDHFWSSPRKRWKRLKNIYSVSTCGLYDFINLRFFSLSCWAMQIATKAKKMQSFIFILLDFSPCFQNQDWGCSKSDDVGPVKILSVIRQRANRFFDPDDHITSALKTSGQKQTEANLKLFN